MYFYHCVQRVSYFIALDCGLSNNVVGPMMRMISRRVAVAFTVRLLSSSRSPTTLQAPDVRGRRSGKVSVIDTMRLTTKSYS